jgi:hypothetical protein
MLNMNDYSESSFMGHYDQSADTLTFVRRTVLSVVLIMGAILVCSITVVVGVDALCRSDIDKWLPVYPNATVSSTEHDFFRPRAMGRTTMILETADAAPKVRAWYYNNRDQLTRGQEFEGNQTARTGIATVEYQVENLPNGQNGSRIYLWSECAYN